MLTYMNTYKDLSLDKLRDSCNLDFAHYTYKRGQCSCCYGPKNQSKIHWRNRTIPDGEDYTYILYKNANNGSGIVTKNTCLRPIEFIEYRFNSAQQKVDVCRYLQDMYGSDWVVLMPESDLATIIVVNREYYLFDYYINAKGHIMINYVDVTS